MADEQTPDNNTVAAEQPQATGPQFSVQKLYLKDVSFESPSAPMIFRETAQPELKMNLTQRVENISDDVYEVVLTVTVTCKVGEKTAYLAEVQQAGVFGLAGFQAEQVQPVLGSYCPSVLFPYARKEISDLVVHGGFQPLLLQPVNFDQLYAQQVQQQAAQQAAAASGEQA